MHVYCASWLYVIMAILLGRYKDTLCEWLWETTNIGTKYIVIIHFNIFSLVEQPFSVVIYKVYKVKIKLLNFFIRIK